VLSFAQKSRAARVVNDAMKFKLIKGRNPSAVAKTQVNLTPQNAG